MFLLKRLICSYKCGQVSYLLILNDLVLYGFSDSNKGCAFLLLAKFILPLIFNEQIQEM